MIRILGIDHNTFETGIFFLDFGLDSSGMEVLKCAHASLSSDINRRLSLQERSQQFMKDVGQIRKLYRYYKPDFVVREYHNPNGTKIVQLSRFTGILDALMAEEGITFKNGKYKEITPIEWKMITLLDPYHELKKDTKAAKQDYCLVFKKVFTFQALQSIKSTDIMDAFGLAYAYGVRYWAEKNRNYFDGLHDEQRRNILDESGNFKQWS